MACDSKNCQSSHYCDLIRLGKTGDCPCGICIIKMICIDSCELYKDHYKKIIGFEPTAFKGY